jgi:hypothetical protein
MRYRRIALIASLFMAGCALSGCESMDPTSWFDTKKPLPGERKEMFPGGVPGVPEGVPRELVKGYQPPTEAPAAVAEEKPKPQPKPKPRPRVVAAPRPTQQPAASQPDAAQGAQAPWPSAPSSPPPAAATPFPNPPAR